MLGSLPQHRVGTVYNFVKFACFDVFECSNPIPRMQEIAAVDVHHGSPSETWG